jgi:hypothetical protein
MIRIIGGFHIKVVRLLLWALVVISPVAGYFSLLPAYAAGSGGEGQQALLAKYPQIKAKLEKNQFGAPIFLESTESGHSVRVDMYGVLEHPFTVVKEALQSPPNWCDITSLHLNTKACTWQKTGNQYTITIYSGRKYYQPPSDAYPLKLKFRLLAQQPDFLSVALSADEGPFRTKDHRMNLEAVPLEKGKTFVHFSYSYTLSRMAQMAVKTYLSTIGRDKLGFTTLPGKGGKGGYVSGERGAIERNTVRYYLAVEAYLDTLKYPEEQRFEQRINRWYDLTAKYPRQLKEMEKGEYLSMQKREHQNQVLLQKGG